MFYAHTKGNAAKSEWQTVFAHLTNTAHLAEKLGSDAGIAALAYMAGLLHDLGKYSFEFQRRLDGAKIRVDHSTAGAKEIVQLFKGTPQEPLARLLAYCISGHHTGLQDYGDASDLANEGTLVSRLKTEVCDFSSYKQEIDPGIIKLPDHLHIRPIKDQMGFSFAFLTRMVYSALVDADFQDTQEFVQGKKGRGGYEDVESLCAKLNDHFRKFDHPKSEINRKRTETLKECVHKANLPQGLFTLTVPTGGGKTLASMAFALNHARKHDLKRIIYIIPFTSIIEQNAAVFKEILGEENVLEHHSNFDWEKKKRESAKAADDLTDDAYAKLKLAVENWDIPIVVTTNVQFFESLFDNRSSHCRKLHNLARSVLIFDEAQMLPRDYLLPAMSAVWELVTNYGASAVFCTATQPKLEQFLPEGPEPVELVSNPQELFEFYKRVEIKILGKITDDELLKRLTAHEQVLCIVNTRKHARGLFSGMEADENFHLSTLMCPVHRKETLAEIRQRLDNRQPCRVISTTVMEAGIDVDFPTGYRALTGLDSINQAAGRVNRNMKFPMAEMFLFEPESIHIKKILSYIAQSVEVTRGVLQRHRAEPISIPAIREYFEQLYSLHDRQDFDYKKILDCFDKGQPRYQFATAAERFRVIEDETVTVIIPYDETAEGLIRELANTEFPFYTLRKLQPYTVSIYQGEFDALSSAGVVLTIADSYPVLNRGKMKEYYHPKTGLIVPASGGGDALFA